MIFFFFFFSSRRRHTRYIGDWSSDVCSSDLALKGSNIDAAKYAQYLSKRKRLSLREVLRILRGVDVRALERAFSAVALRDQRSEERRVGKEWRSWWSRRYFMKPRV